MNPIRFIFTKIIFMTPLGYLWGYFDMINHNRIDEIGLQIQFPDKQNSKDFEVFVKDNPSFTDRSNWFIDGIGLNLQAIYLVFFRPELFTSKINIVGYYSALCVTFGIIQIAIALFPKANWNKKL